MKVMLSSSTSLALEDMEVIQEEVVVEEDLHMELPDHHMEVVVVGEDHPIMEVVEGEGHPIMGVVVEE